MSDPWLEIDCGPNVPLRRSVIPSLAPMGRLIWDCMLVTAWVPSLPTEPVLAQRFGREVYFPEQVHGIEVVCVDQESPVITADAAVTDQLHCPIGIITADCLPSFVCKPRSDWCCPCRLARARGWGT